MFKAVLDTNIIISYAISEKGNPARIMTLVSSGFVKIYYSDNILAEYTEVLSREKFNFSPEKQKDALKEIEDMGIKIDHVPSVIPLPDESDRIFYDLAKEAGAYLITGNKKHFPDEKFIVSPAEFLEILEN
jgi:putative PIN family toxin of toxin-antitoxin system